MLDGGRAWAARRPEVAAVLALGAMVVVSAGLRLLAARTFTVPWIAPDEMVYGLLGQDLWERGTLTIRGFDVPYHSLLYPAFVGLPLLAGELADGIRLAQALQALVISLAAVPVYLWGRRFLGRRWALAAAALTLLTPALTYAGLLMTEALFYPATAVALAALARVLETPTLMRQGAFLLAVTFVAAIRLQALLLLPALVGAALLYALFVRSAKILRRLWPILGILALGSLLAVTWVFVSDDAGLDDVVGAYAAGARPDSTALGWELVWHAGYVAILGAFLPFLATGTLVWRAARTGETDPPVAAFLAATASFVPLLAAQVALFAAENVDHVGGRYLITALPLLALGVCLWGVRGAPWERIGTPVLAIAMVALVALTPIDQSAAAAGAHDLFETLVLRDLADATSDAMARIVLVAAAAFGVLAIVLVARRHDRYPAGASIAVLATGAVLAAASLVAALDVARLSEKARERAFGPAVTTWVDDAGDESSVLLATGELLWTSNARILFWNESIQRIVALPSAEWHGPLPVLSVTLSEQGEVIREDGTVLSASRAVAPSTLVLEGEALAVAAMTTDEPEKTLWRMDGALRATTSRAGFTPVGDILGEAGIVVYGCKRGGALELTLLGKEGKPINIGVNGIPVRTVTIEPEKVWRGSIPAPPDADGSRSCYYVLESPGLVGSTRVEWIPPPTD